MERSIFARTATALAVDVSVLRRRMQTLEAFIGAPLFEGRGNRLRLTAAGRRARVQAVRTLEAAAELALIGEQRHVKRGSFAPACSGFGRGGQTKPLSKLVQGPSEGLASRCLRRR